ncbi:MAG: hypothetical protein EXR98_07105 [Gemmataceae bacterium]|nr:hypothetical protein [Gemmataceae bacterium]
MPQLVVVIAACLFAHSTLLAQESAKVNITVQIPAKADSFKDQQLEVLLFEYDPRIADKAATQLDKHLLKTFAHTTGKETRQEITLGEKTKVDAKMRYYVTVFVLDSTGKRTHIGEKDGKSGLCNVLTNGNPSKVTSIVRSVK